MRALIVALAMNKLQGVLSLRSLWKIMFHPKYQQVRLTNSLDVHTLAYLPTYIYITLQPGLHRQELVLIADTVIVSICGKEAQYSYRGICSLP
jgi:hypothetical protein